MALSEITKEVLRLQPIVVDTNWDDNEWREHQHYFGIKESTHIGFEWKEVEVHFEEATYFNPSGRSVEYIIDDVYLVYWDGEQEELSEEDIQFIFNNIKFI